MSAVIEAELDDPRWAAVDASLSIWVEGYGEVAALEPDARLLPASNQKLLTAIGTHLLLDPDLRFVTEVLVEPDGDLVIVAGGDPTLADRGSHSLDALARTVTESGVGQVGDVVVDAERYERRPNLPGWQAWQMPTYVGPLSALMVDDNRFRTDRGYLLDPTAGNGARFADHLVANGVTITGVVRQGTAGADATVLATTSSAPVRDLLGSMLTASHNVTAESLVREIGVSAADEGSTAAGLAAIDAALATYCLDLKGSSGDGSGLSRDNLRSAREWRRLLQVVRAEPWFGDFVGELAVAGRTGTLARRLTDPATAGNVVAKTGSIIGGRALSGYATTAGGRAVVFSMVVNGDRSGDAVGAIDTLISAVVADES